MANTKGPPHLEPTMPVAACQGAVDSQRASSVSSPLLPPEPAQIVKANVSGWAPHHHSQTRWNCTQRQTEATVAKQGLEGIRRDAKRADGFL